MEAAFQLDGLRASHPIEVPVSNALEIDQVFDAISYRKGCSVIRMLSGHIGVETFLKGVSNYLKQHAYGNATTNDLWSAISEASGQDVKAFMEPWIRKIGYPVLTVAEEPGQIGVRQSRFLASGDVKSDEDQTQWWLPLGLETGPKAAKSHMKALTTKEETIREIDDSYYKLNKDHAGFYRTNYPPERLAKLGSARTTLSTEDRIGLISDSSALAVSGDGTTAGLLAFVESFQEEKDYFVWSQILGSINSLRQIFSHNDKITDALKKFTLKLITPITEEIGWEFAPNESYLTSQLRALLISSAGGAGHKP